MKYLFKQEITSPLKNLKNHHIYKNYFNYQDEMAFRIAYIINKIIMVL